MQQFIVELFSRPNVSMIGEPRRFINAPTLCDYVVDDRQPVEQTPVSHESGHKLLSLHSLNHQVIDKCRLHMPKNCSLLRCRRRLRAHIYLVAHCFQSLHSYKLHFKLPYRHDSHFILSEFIHAQSNSIVFLIRCPLPQGYRVTCSS